MSRRVVPGAVTALVAVLVTGLVWWGSADLVGAALVPVTRADRFAPVDGSRVLARDAEGVTVTETARTTGAALAVTAPAALVGAVAQSLGNDALAGLRVWRTTRTRYDAEAGTRQSTTVRALTPRGIEQLATYGAVTLVFTPALLEVPADVHAGSVWTSAGTARPDGSIRYASTWRAAGVDGRPTCVRVTGSIRFTAKDGSTLSDSASDDTWCDGAGATTTGAVTETTRPPSFERPTQTVPTSLGDVATWRSTLVPAAVDDGFFGTSPFQAQVDVPPVRLSDYTLVVPDRTTGDVVGLSLPESTLVPTWVGHPGGAVTALAGIGSVTVVGTSDRRLTAYGPDGAWLWTHAVRDVPLTAPVDVGGGRVAVTALDGTVAVLEVATGREIWSATFPAEIRVAPVRDGRRLVVGDRSGVLRALDLATGRVLWQTTGDPVTHLAVVAGRLVTLAGPQAHGLDPATGDERWSTPVDGAPAEVVALGATGASALTVAGVVTTEHTLGLDPATGRVLWDRPGSRTALGLGGLLVEVVAGRVRAVDGTGRLVHEWTPSGIAPDARSAWSLVPSPTGVDVVDGSGGVVRLAP